MVGTQTKLMESTKDTNEMLNTAIKRKLLIPKMEPISPAPSPPPLKQRLIAPAPTPKNILSNNYHKKQQQQQNLEVEKKEISNSETLYGTYDMKTHSITIELPDENISISEAVEEIVYCDGSTDNEDDDMSEVTLLSPIPNNYPSPGYYSSNEISDTKSTSLHSISESGYESLGSPISTTNDMSHMWNDECWNDSFTELFPSLL